MKKIKFLLLLLPLIVLGSCVKQKECGFRSGTLYYQEKSFNIDTYCKDNVRINAIFIDDKTGGEQYITGTIPSKYKDKNGIRVNVRLEETCKSGYFPDATKDFSYELTCIEEEAL